MEKLTLNETFVQSTPGETHSVTFTKINTIHQIYVKELKINGVGVTPHSIELHFEDNSESSISARSLLRDNIYTSTGRQVGTEWVDKPSSPGHLLQSHAQAKAYNKLAFRVLNGDDKSALTFTRLTIKLEFMTFGGEKGNREATNVVYA